MQPNQEQTSTNVTIPVTLLDSLMNLAGELVLGRNQLLQAIHCDDRWLLETTSQRINRVTSEIQEQIMRTRMQPMGTLFDTLPPVVAETARACAKKVTLSVAGKDVELDKTLLNLIDQPLSWLIRQAVSHGIESPDRRVTTNKPRQGTGRNQGLPGSRPGQCRDFRRRQGDRSRYPDAPGHGPGIDRRWRRK